MNLSEFQVHVDSLKTPHVHRYFGDVESLAGLNDYFSELEFLILGIDGKETSTYDNFHTCMKSTMGFYDWYGDNWNAYHELMIDLDWQKFSGVLLEFHNADHVLRRDPEELNTFLNLQELIGKTWSDGDHLHEGLKQWQIPFYTVLCCRDRRFARQINDLV